MASPRRKKAANSARKPPPARVPAPALPYRPRDPLRYRPAIGLIGCGGITKWHLRAYRRAKYRVVALCDVDRRRAIERRDEFYPRAEVTTDYREILDSGDVSVVDIATHPPERPPLIEAALRAKKHVLSQKPFVLDLDVGQRLADLADQMGVRLAVNQNGRWAPHWSYIRAAAQAGLLGTIDAVHCDVHWNHSWIAGTPFESLQHVILYDYAIHWFDFVTTLMGAGKMADDEIPLAKDRSKNSSFANSVFAATARSASQTVRPPLLAQAMIDYGTAQASLVFDAHTRCGQLDRTLVVGSRGTIRSEGPSGEKQRVTLETPAGIARPRLSGSWFPDGFHGTMGELLCAIEEDRQPANSARNNLPSLALCFAAVASAERGEPVAPGSVRKLP
jgi:predicted dehydrogenase